MCCGEEYTSSSRQVSGQQRVSGVATSADRHSASAFFPSFSSFYPPPLTLPSFSSIYPPPPHFTLLFCCSWFPLSHFPLLLYFLLLLISPSFSFSLPPKIFLILVFPDVLKVFYLSHIWSDFSIVFTLPFLLLNGKWEANYVCLRMYLVTLVWLTTWDDGSTSDDLRRHYRGQGGPSLCTAFSSINSTQTNALISTQTNTNTHIWGGTIEARALVIAL